MIAIIYEVYKVEKKPNGANISRIDRLELRIVKNDASLENHTTFMIQAYEMTGERGNRLAYREIPDSDIPNYLRSIRLYNGKIEISDDTTAIVIFAGNKIINGLKLINREGFVQD